MPHGRIGLRTLKTGLAVSLSLLITWLVGSQYPIFAVVAAISAMSRTVSGTLESCRQQLTGTAFGAFTGCLFLFLFPSHPLAFIGIGVILVICFCNLLRIPTAIPLSCIVFCVICLNSPGTNNVLYSFYRFVDTLVGLLVTFGVNALIMPYNNLPEIEKMMRRMEKDILRYARDKVIVYHIPDLTPLSEQLKSLNHELNIYEKEPIQQQKRRKDSAYLRGCQQLLTKMSEELFAICHLDSTPIPTEENLEAMKNLGLDIPPYYNPDGKCDMQDHIVLNFHLANLLNGYSFLTELLDSPDFPALPPAPWASWLDPWIKRCRALKIRLLRLCLKKNR